MLERPAVFVPLDEHAQVLAQELQGGHPRRVRGALAVELCLPAQAADDPVLGDLRALRSGPLLDGNGCRNPSIT